MTKAKGRSTQLGPRPSARKIARKVSSYDLGGAERSLSMLRTAATASARKRAVESRGLTRLEHALNFQADAEDEGQAQLAETALIKAQNAERTKEHYLALATAIATDNPQNVANTFRDRSALLSNMPRGAAPLLRARAAKVRAKARQSAPRQARRSGRSGIQLRGVGQLRGHMPGTHGGVGLYGKGGYYGDLVGKGLTAAGGLVSRLGPWGALAGTGLGLLGKHAGRIEDSLAPTAIGAAWRRATGQGDYEMLGNDTIRSETGGAAHGGIPTFTSSPNIVTISHKEYVTDVFGPEGAGMFQNVTYPLNPGLAGTFPWLSQVAANYDEFTLKQCIFTFRSTVTDFVASNGQVGTVIMATQYNASDPPFISKQDMMEYDLAMSGKCSQSMMHGVECDPRQLSMAVGKYTRAGPPPPGEDLKTYDHGVLNIGVSNIPAQFSNQALGELWVTYTVELRKPKFFVTRGLNILRDSFVANSTSDTLGKVSVPEFGLLAWGRNQQDRIGGKLGALTKDRADAVWANPNWFFPGYRGLGTAPVIEAPANSTTLSYTFPAQFSGTVRILLSVLTAPINPALAGISTVITPLWTNSGASYSLVAGTVFAPSSSCWPYVNAQPSGATQTIDFPSISGGLAIQPIKDIWGGLSSAAPWGTDKSKPVQVAWTCALASQSVPMEKTPTLAWNAQNGNFATCSYELHLNIITPTSAASTIDNIVYFNLATYTVGDPAPTPQTAIMYAANLDVSLYNGSYGAGSFNNTGVTTNTTSGQLVVGPQTNEVVPFPQGAQLLP